VRELDAGVGCLPVNVGYARVSRADQDPELQFRELKAAGCGEIFEEKASGAKGVLERPALAEALRYCREEDVLVVWRLDRLGRSLRDLIDVAALEEKLGRNVLRSRLSTVEKNYDNQGTWNVQYHEAAVGRQFAADAHPPKAYPKASASWTTCVEHWRSGRRTRSRPNACWSGWKGSLSGPRSATRPCRPRSHRRAALAERRRSTPVPHTFSCAKMLTRQTGQVRGVGMPWQLQDAKQRFSELVRRAVEEGPQTVTRRGEEVVVVVPAEEWRRVSGGGPDFKGFLLSGPDLGALEIGRRREPPREAEL
jgi:prevent-host-death family protein